jgi:hypothetical protein
MSKTPKKPRETTPPAAKGAGINRPEENKDSGGTTTSHPYRLLAKKTGNAFVKASYREIAKSDGVFIKAAYREIAKSDDEFREVSDREIERE